MKYKQAYDWLYAAGDMLKPGVSTVEIARQWPEAHSLGLESEAAVFALELGHGIGIAH